MVVGEPQILGQVKEAFAVARARGTVSGQLGTSAAIRFRGGQAGSDGDANRIELCFHRFGCRGTGAEDLWIAAGRTVFLVGAGKMSELAARHLVQQGAGAILVTNRTQERARQLAEPFDGRVIPFEKLYETATEADIVISSTGAPHPIFRQASTGSSSCIVGGTGPCSLLILPFRATSIRR